MTRTATKTSTVFFKVIKNIVYNFFSGLLHFIILKDYGIFNSIKMHCIYNSSPLLQVNALQSAKIIHRKLRYEEPEFNLIFHWIPVIFSLLIFSKNCVSIAEAVWGYLVPFSPFINLLILFVVMSENIFKQMESSLARSKWSPCWTVIQDCHPVSRRRLWSSFPSVIRSQACALWKKTITGDWQPTTGFMAVVSGGRQVSQLDDCQRDFTLPSCALKHTVLPLLCSCWLIFTAVCPCSSHIAVNNKWTRDLLQALWSLGICRLWKHNHCISDVYP